MHIVSGEFGEWALAAKSQDSLEMCRIVRLERLGRAWKIKIVQPGDPETKSRTPEHGRPTHAFSCSEGPDAGVRFQPRIHKMWDQLTGGSFNAPVVDANSDIKQPGIASGKIKIDDATHVWLFMGT